MFKVILAAAVLSLGPGVVMAQQGCSFGQHEDRVMSCADGTMWDTKAGTCVAIVTG